MSSVLDDNTSSSTNLCTVAFDQTSLVKKMKLSSPNSKGSSSSSSVAQKASLVACQVTSKFYHVRGVMKNAYVGSLPLRAVAPSHSKALWWPSVFRREPLWKVSMNVRILPTIRCTFDDEDNVLRIVLKEAVEYNDGSPETKSEELVVYAFKVHCNSKGR